MVKKRDREEGKCDLADEQDMQAREASPEAGGHSLLLNGGVGWHGVARWIGTRVRWSEAGDEPLTAMHREEGKEEKKGTAKRETRRAVGGINERTSPAQQLRRMIARVQLWRKALRMRRAGSGMQLLKGACIPRLEIVRTLAVLSTGCWRAKE